MDSLFDSASATTHQNELDAFIIANLGNDDFEFFDFSSLVEGPQDTPVSSVGNYSPPDQQSNSFELASNISFTLPEIQTQDGMKITNEIILNFDPVSASTVEPMDVKIDELEILNQMISSNAAILSASPAQDTRIEINDDQSDDEDDDDDSSRSNGPKSSKSSKSGKIVLTDEEIGVYTKEGFNIPTRWPLTKSEEKILRLVKRKIRNKKSAHVSRERKKKYVDGLEKRVDLCTKENETLLNRVRILETQNNDLMNKLNTIQVFLSKLLNKNKKTSTAVLFISCFVTFCAYPFFDLTESDPDSLYMISNRYSRTLLSMPDDSYSSTSFAEILSSNTSAGLSYIYNLVFS